MISFACLVHGNCQYYSEVGQDEYVDENFFDNQASGFYVDIGAHEGVEFSNTLFFEQLGWKGVCFEPDPRSFKKLKQNRSCIALNYAVGSENKIEKFIQHPCSYVSGLDRTYQDAHRKCWNVPKGNAEKYFIDVQVVNLNEKMDELGVQHIDFLSIDTEGAEKDIIMSIDFDRLYIYVIVLENKYNDESIRSYLEEKGFKYINRLHRDEVFVNTRREK